MFKLLSINGILSSRRNYFQFHKDPAKASFEDRYIKSNYSFPRHTQRFMNKILSTLSILGKNLFWVVLDCIGQINSPWPNLLFKEVLQKSCHLKVLLPRFLKQHTTMEALLGCCSEIHSVKNPFSKHMDFQVKVKWMKRIVNYQIPTEAWRDRLLY